MEDRVIKIKNKYEQQLLKLTNVVGVGIGKKMVGGKESDKLAIIVFVVKKLPKSKLEKANIIPESLEGVPIDIREVGVVKALRKKESRSCLTMKP